MADYTGEYARSYIFIDVCGKSIIDIGADTGTSAMWFINAGAKKVTCYSLEKQQVFRPQIEWRGKWSGEPLPAADVLKIDCEGCECALTPLEISKFKEYYIAIHRFTPCYYRLQRFLEEDAVKSFITPDGVEVMYVKTYKPFMRREIKSDVDVAIITRNSGSFGFESQMLLTGLLQEGVSARLYPEDIYSYYRGTHVFHPHWTSASYKNGMHTIGHSAILMVADGTPLSKRYIDFLNNDVAQVLTVSEYSKEAFVGYHRHIGIVNNVAPDLSNFSVDKRYDVFLSAPHSPDRKGLEPALKAARQIPGLKLAAHVGIVPLPGITTLVGNVSYYDRIKLMNQSNIFLYPVRGGAFEIPVLEAAMLGVTPVVTDRGPWTEFLRINDYYPIKIDGESLLYQEDMVQTGYGYIVNEESVAEELQRALDKPKVINRKYYANKYSSRNMARQFLNEVEIY